MKKLILFIVIIVGVQASYAGFPITKDSPTTEKVELVNDDESTITTTASFPEFQTGAFLMGLFISLIGVLLVYLITKDKAKRYWVWYGAAISSLLGLLLL